jgi:hypothetical protein
MKRQVSMQRQPWVRTAVYSFMTLSVAVIVTLLMLVVLGYQFNKKDGRIEQGGLLQFQSIPSGAGVTLDGSKLGSLTATKSTVDTGSHFVSYNLANYRTWQKTIGISAGQIGWLSYARLIPSTIKPEVLHEYTNLSSTLSTESRNYMLLHEDVASPTFTLVNIQGDTLRYDTLTLPATSYTSPTTGKTQSFTLDSWSANDSAVLIRHVYDDNKTEWVLLNRSSPDRSINITTTYGVTPSKVQFAGTGDRLLYVRTDNEVRRINLDEQTLSRPLATNVDTFSEYDDKTIIYSTIPDDKGQRNVAYAAVDIAQPIVLGTYPADGQPLFAAMGSYFNQRYIAIIYGQSLKITYGTVPTFTDKGSMKPFATQTIPVGTTAFAISRNNRFFVAQLPDGYATYDIELKKYDKTTWATQPTTPRPLNWLDDYTLWSDYGGQLRLYEFDGANQQNIMPVAEGFATSLSPNDKYVYTITKTAKGYQLQRGLLIVQ